MTILKNILAGIARLCSLFFIGLIWLYRITIRPFLKPQCRFTPSCSAYGLQAFRELPLHTAAIRTARRILQCHPWGKSGYDPVHK